MAVDFWKAQKRARSRTTLYLIIFVVLTVAMAALVEYGMRIFAGDSYEVSFPLMGILFGGLIFVVSGFQYLSFQGGGGGRVAESLGAYRVNPKTTNLKEVQLLNIVQEMAVAASLPVPPVYILKTPQINAFAAGLTPQNAAVTVTEGTLNLLDRDELQGVVAHEFGHIYNGDMKISMRLAAMLMGFFFALYIGLRLLQFTSFRRSNEKQGLNPVAVGALLFIVAGALTWFFGSLLKLAISREREYLADACAIQFTRNPDGIANALRKIATETTNDMPVHGDAYSHMYFNDHSLFSSLFATHPPIKKRIAAILGREYIPKEWNIPDN